MSLKAYGGRRHLATRDGRRCPVALTATAAAAASVQSYGGWQSGFTISAMVYLAQYGTALAIWSTFVAGGVRFTITTTGQISLGNGTDTVVSAAGLMPRCEWTRVEVKVWADRTVQFLLNAEVVHQAVLPGTQAWVGGTWNFSAPTGSRIQDVRAHARPITLAESKDCYYEWRGPSPAVLWPLDESIGNTVTERIGGGTAALSSHTWLDVPAFVARPVRPPVGYSLRAWALGDGTNANNHTSTPFIPSALMTQLRGRPGLSWMVRTRAQGWQTNSFRVFGLGLAGANVVGPSLRMDNATAGTNTLAINGRMVASTGNSVQPAVTGNLRDRITWDWHGFGARLDYAGNRAVIDLDGLPLVDQANAMNNADCGAGFTVASGYNAGTPDGQEQIAMGAYIAQAVNNARARMLQTDHLICNRFITTDEARAWWLYGVAPAGTVFRASWSEGFGNTHVEPVAGVSCLIQRGGVNFTDAWDAEVPFA